MTHGTNWYAIRRKKMLAYVGDFCVQCGSDYKLEFDHIDPTTKSFNVGECYSYSWDILKIELDKCQLLCFDCHKEKSNSRHPIVHNRWRYLKHRCRCDTCKADYKLYRQQRYLRGSK